MSVVDLYARSSAEQRLQEVARNQGGVVSRVQLREAGISARVQQDRVRRGSWANRGRAVIIHALVTPGDLHDAWLLQIEAGSQAIVSGPVAARLGGWYIAGSERILVMTAHDKKAPVGVRVLRRENPAWPVKPIGLRLASPIDAMADTAICRSWTQACALIDHALQQRWIDADSFDELIGHRAGHGRRGVGRLRQLRERVISGSRSEAEQRMASILKKTGTGPWRANYPIIDDQGRVVAELDFALVRERIAIEIDGRAFHSDDLSFERDRLRQNQLMTKGWMVLRFTWQQMTDDPQRVKRTVQAAVTRVQQISG